MNRTRQIDEHAAHVAASLRVAATIPPSDKRPYRLASATGDELNVITADRSMTFRQVGWHGQTGAFYALGEDPSKHEPGSFGPLWILAFNDPIVRDEP